LFGEDAKSARPGVETQDGGPLGFVFGEGCCEGTAPHLFADHVTAPDWPPTAWARCMADKTHKGQCRSFSAGSLTGSRCAQSHEEDSPMESYVGLDVHSKRSVFVIETSDGRVRARGDIPTNRASFRQLRQQYTLAAETPVALDTGTVAFYLCRAGTRAGRAPAGGNRCPRGTGEGPSAAAEE